VPASAACSTSDATSAGDLATMRSSVKSVFRSLTERRRFIDADLGARERMLGRLKK